MVIHDARKVVLWRDGGHGKPLFQVAMSQDRGVILLRFGLQDTRHAPHVGKARKRHIGVEQQQNILPVRLVERFVDDVVDGVGKETGGDQYCHGERDPEQRCRRAQRPARQAAKDHARRLRETDSVYGAIEDRATEIRWGGRRHGDGRRQPRRVNGAAQGPQRRRGKRQKRGQRIDACRHTKDEKREIEVPRVQGGRGLRKPASRHETNGNAHEGDKPGQHEVMQTDIPARIPYGLHQSDFSPFKKHDAPDNEVHEKNRDAKEHRRQNVGKNLQLRDLGIEKGVRLLKLSVKRAGPTVRFEKLVKRIRHVGGLRTRQKRQRHVTEGAVHIERRVQHLVRQPQNAIAFVFVALARPARSYR